MSRVTRSPDRDPRQGPAWWGQCSWSVGSEGERGGSYEVWERGQRGQQGLEPTVKSCDFILGDGLLLSRRVPLSPF